MHLACKPTYVPKIIQGRKQIEAMPREWVVQNIDRAADETLDLNDYWDYRRLLELLIIINARDSFNRSIAVGLAHTDYDIHEAAEDFSGTLDGAGGV
ncbi:hypothetical protein FRUB_02107 [Fimbriiglobus ruber]|uniref:Uncharacterized protein n=1 Tax=Fimbriiglobus ruber TaxID=1908690 RepID=A0A225E6N6_9BACT|nr:hypothetical protein FRUB_02107 [Fimbriiglobus ruber]